MNTVLDIKNLIGKECEIIGDANRKWYNVQSIYNASVGDLTFCSKKGKKALELLTKTKASVILCNNNVLLENINFKQKTLIVVKNPRLWIARVIEAFFCTKIKRKGISVSAKIGKNCSIGKNVYIGDYTVIGDNATIGDETKIDSGVSINSNAIIGKNIVIKPGAVIGYDGFGFERNEKGEYEKFPHRGNVIIEDDVTIGANSCVDRGTFGNTVIGRGTKIDNLVHIGHNSIIGKHCVITAFVCTGGCEIGDGAWLGIHSIVWHVKVGRRALIGMGAVVLKDVGEEDVVVGVPARVLRKRRKDDLG